MGIFQPPPGTSTTDYPDITPTDWVSIGAQIATGAGKSEVFDKYIVKAWHYFKEFMFFIISGLMGGMNDIAAFFVEASTAAQGIGQPGMVNLMRAVLGDLLGMEFSDDQLQAVLAKGGRLGVMQKVGTWLFNTLVREFSGFDMPKGYESKTAPAMRFLGFLIEFAVREGNLSFLAEVIPEEFNPFGGLREYGENLAKYLGLGRLARRALQPLIQELVGTPLQEALNNQYRPKRIAEGPAIRAFLRGDWTEANMREELAWQGWRDDRIDHLIADEYKLLTVKEYMTLFRMGLLQDADVTGLLQNDGYAEDDAANLWTATKFLDQEPLMRHYLDHVISEVRNGFLTIPEGFAAFDLVQLTRDERSWYSQILEDMRDHNWRHLSESEAERAFLGGIIDLSTIQDYWQRLGYSQVSVQVLTLLLLEKQASGNRVKGGHTPHKHLTEAQLEKAYSSGILNIGQLQAGWTSLGYSPNDVLVLTALVEVKTPPPGQTVFPSMTAP